MSRIQKLLAITLVLVPGLHAQAKAPAPDLSDPEVAHVALTANSIDIELAKVALSRSGNAEETP